MPKLLKDTLILPSTDLPMRANATENEPKRLSQWEQLDLYHRILQQNMQNVQDTAADGGADGFTAENSFILHDGPPYANGPIHIGHVLNKVLKDIIVKYHALLGQYTPYVPGWDCHGQPIEHMVTSKLGAQKAASLDKSTIRRLCREWAAEHVDKQRDGFIRLGILADWEHPYLTYDKYYEAANIQIFKQMYLSGQIYQGRKPVHWCPSCQTALAEAEIEYAPHTSNSVYVSFKLTGNVDENVIARSLGDKAIHNVPTGATHILIWTTTPWTLPANRAVSVNPSEQYITLKREGNSDGFIVAEQLVESTVAALGWDKYTVSQPIAGSELEGLTYQHPIFADDGAKNGVVICGSHVTMEAGTGCVHTAPGHGQEDYAVVLEYDLDYIMPVNDAGVFTDEGGPFAGEFYAKANPLIIDYLTKRGALLKQSDLEHSYPHCWRCHNPVIFRATNQVFVRMDKAEDSANVIAKSDREPVPSMSEGAAVPGSLRTLALDAAESVRWYPEWSHNRLKAMIEGRPDWCISRQRAWGVPIPLFTCQTCGATVATVATFDAVIALFAEQGADAWFEQEPKDYLPSDTCCETCGAGVEQLAASGDILDVWWESGVSHTAVLGGSSSVSETFAKPPSSLWPKHNADDKYSLKFPASMYLEGSDQHRGWFQSSLLTAVGTYKVAPFESVMSCGFVVDNEGRKMSKSLGNVIDPADVIAKYGADVLRLWVASVDSGQDMSMSDEVLQRISESYRRIRNSFKYLLGNLAEFSAADMMDYAELNQIDQWIVARAAQVRTVALEAYAANTHHIVYHTIYDFINTDLSNVYLDVVKDRLYCSGAQSLERISAQTALAFLLDTLTYLLSPILSFLTEEVWQNYPEELRGTSSSSADNAAQSVFLVRWNQCASAPMLSTLNISEQAISNATTSFTEILQVRDSVNRAIEDMRTAGTITKSQQVDVAIKCCAETFAVLEQLGAEVLAELFIVSSVDLVLDEVLKQTQDSIVSVTASQAEKCPRCWNYRSLVDVSDLHYEDGTAVCARCAEVLQSEGAV